MNASVEKAINHEGGADVSRDVTLVEAVNMALAREMANDDSVVVLGRMWPSMAVCSALPPVCRSASVTGG